jgi:hypothetical protein
MCEMLLSKLMKSIEVGAIRVSGNLLVDLQPFSISNNILSLKVAKVTVSSLQKQNLIRTELIPMWKSDFVEISVPYNELFGSFKTIIILERLWNHKLFKNDYIKSDIVDVDIYSSEYPIAFNGKVSNTKVDIKELKSAI